MSEQNSAREREREQKRERERNKIRGKNSEEAERIESVKEAVKGHVDS